MPLIWYSKERESRLHDTTRNIMGATLTQGTGKGTVGFLVRSTKNTNLVPHLLYYFNRPRSAPLYYFNQQAGLISPHVSPSGIGVSQYH